MISTDEIFSGIKASTTATTHFIISAGTRQVGLSTRKLIKAGPLVALYARHLGKIEEHEVETSVVSAATASAIRELNHEGLPYTLTNSWRRWYLLNAGRVVFEITTKRHYHTKDEFVRYMQVIQTTKALPAAESWDYTHIMTSEGTLFEHVSVPEPRAVETSPVECMDDD